MVFDIITDHLLVAVLTDRVEVVAAGPELATPQLLLDGWVTFEDFPARDALGRLNQTARQHGGHALDQEVGMVFVSADLEVANFVTVLDLPTDGGQSLRHLVSQYFPAILDWTD